jgi:RNA polymerase sigma-70 factor, ECF subfamily
MVSLVAPLPLQVRMTVTADPRIARAAAGDRAACEALVRTLLPRVRNLVRYLVRNDADVDDMAQLALIAIVKGLSSYRGEGKFESWADRITARETLAYVRRRRVAARTADAAAAEQVVESAHVSEDFLARRRLAVALDALADEQRSVVVLHHIAGFSMPEIAETLGIPFETARSRMRLGLAKLREIMDTLGEAS